MYLIVKVFLLQEMMDMQEVEVVKVINTTLISFCFLRNFHNMNYSERQHSEHEVRKNTYAHAHRKIVPDDVMTSPSMSSIGSR